MNTYHVTLEKLLMEEAPHDYKSKLKKDNFTTFLYVSSLEKFGDKRPKRNVYISYIPIMEMARLGQFQVKNGVIKH